MLIYKIYPQHLFAQSLASSENLKTAFLPQFILSGPTHAFENPVRIPLGTGIEEIDLVPNVEVPIVCHIDVATHALRIPVIIVAAATMWTIIAVTRVFWLTNMDLDRGYARVVHVDKCIAEFRVRGLARLE